MKQLILLLMLIISGTLKSQTGGIINALILKSQILKNEQHLNLYLPEGYDTSHTAYPVIYLLHGAGGNYTSWDKEGNMKAISDSFIKATHHPCIIVMPDAAMTFYLNNIHGKYQYEDYFMQELIPYIETHYRCRKEKNARAVAGLSMGGYGSLLYAMHHPDLFSSCYAMSAAVRTDEDVVKMPLPDFQRRYQTALDTLANTRRRITPFWHANGILYIAEHMPEEQRKQVRFFIDCGDDDPLSKGSALLHIIMQEKEISHEYRVRNGAHTWDYWQTSLPQALQFISQDFYPAG